MSVSKKMQVSIDNSSWIRKMFTEGAKRKAKYGAENVFDFSIGNPNLDPPARFKQVLVEQAMDSSPGVHAYMDNAGFNGVRQAVADHLSKHNRPDFTANDIVMTVGSGGGLNVVLKTILDPADEVIIPKPFFMEYYAYVDNHQGVPILVSTNNDFSFDFDAVEKAVTKKTRAFMINSPNNPTGIVYPEDILTELVDLLAHYSKKNGAPIYLISDEPYRRLVYDDITVPSVFDAYNETFVVTSFSKDLSVPGERIGYVAAHPEISDRATVSAGMVLCNRILGYVNAPALMQRIVPFLLEDSVAVSLYQEKRDMICDGLSALGYEFIRPQGAFYLFPKTPIEDDLVFVTALQEENILTVPGKGFGGPGHFRIAYCVSDEVIKGAMPRFERVINKYKKA